MDSFVNFFKKIPGKFASSAKELGKVQSIAIIAMLLALRVILGMFGNFGLAFNPYVKIGFTFLPMAIIAYYFGPLCSMVVAGLGDVLSYVFAPPGASFTPGITAGYMVEGLIMGIILYNEKIGFVRAGLCQVCATIFGGLAINTYFIYMFYGLTYFQLFMFRASLLIPWSIVQGFIIVFIVKALDRANVLKRVS